MNESESSTAFVLAGGKGKRLKEGGSEELRYLLFII